MNEYATPTMLAERLGQYGQAYLLLDRMAGLPLRDELASCMAEQWPLDDPLFQETPEQAPLLVRLGADASPLLADYVALAIEEARHPVGSIRDVCAVFFSSQPGEQLAKQLAQQLDLRVKTGLRLYFRYYDPRVMAHLPHLLPPSHMARLLHGIDHWCYAHWLGQFVSLAGADFGPASNDPAYLRPSVSAAQWEALQEIETFNLALRLARQGALPLDDLTDTRLRGALPAVSACRLQRPEDRATLACLIARHGEPALHQPLLQRALAVVREDAIPLQDLLETPEYSTLY